MNPVPAFLDTALFVGLPYVALVLFVLVSIQRYRGRRFTYSSLSSQFLENRLHFWSLVPFHYGLLAVLTLHAVAFLVPRGLIAFNRVPVRLFVLESAAFAFGLAALWGLVSIVVRRLTVRKALVVASPMDWVLYALLVLQAALGLGIAAMRPWGYAWFPAVMAPYLWSLFTLTPDTAAVSVMPWLIQLHVVNAFLIIAVFPFTRLVHALVAPLPYLWRRPQVVRWYRKPGSAVAGPRP